jgi:hypothetical protein
MGGTGKRAESTSDILAAYPVHHWLSQPTANIRLPPISFDRLASAGRPTHAAAGKRGAGMTEDEDGRSAFEPR